MSYELIAEKLKTLKTEELSEVSLVSERYQQELVDFVDFLLFKQDAKSNDSVDSIGGKKASAFGALKDKIEYIAPDFDDPIPDFAEYM